MVIKNRKEVEETIYTVFDAIDPSKINSMKYRREFADLDDKEFAAYMKLFLDNPHDQFILDLVEFENVLNFDQCEACAKVLDIPLMETIYMPHLTGDRENVVSSVKKCLVGYCPIKRTQQLLHKKNGLAVNNTKINQITGQVIGDDKNARDSDVEAAMLISLGADKIIGELHGPRADDSVMRHQLRKAISEQGYASLDELDNNRANKTTLVTISTFFLCMGIKSDLVSSSYILPKTSEDHF